MQGVTAWTYFDRFGNQRQLSIPTTRDECPPVASPFELTEEQSSELFVASEPDVLIAELRKVIPNDIRRVPYAVLHPFVSDQMHAAGRHGLIDSGDLTQYLLLAVFTSGCFVEHETAVTRLAATAQAHTQTFADWVAALPDSIWATGAPLWASVSKKVRANEQ
jgi:hypothetical protein